MKTSQQLDQRVLNYFGLDPRVRDEDVPNWVVKARRCMIANGIKPSKAAHQIVVEHEPTCVSPYGQGECDCDPDVAVQSERRAEQEEQIPA